ncbi:hypothetical protein STEG23_019156, partial [Scotinomys teguina]
MMNDIILEIYDLPKSYLACTLLAFTLIIHTAFKYWFMHKKILSLESANQDLQNRLLNLESTNLMQELQSINNKCTAKIGFVDNKYEYLMDRTLTLQSEVVTTQTLCKEERLSLIDKIRSLESCVSEEHNRWYDSMKNLESQAREEVHSLEQTLCARLQALEETLCKHDKEPNKQKGKTIKVITSPNGSNPMAYPVIIHERPADDTHPEPYVTHTLQPISIRDFKNMKEAIVTYGIHSTYVKQMLNSWSTSNRIIPDDWHQLTSAVLEYSQQLQWKSWLREEARNLEQQGILMQREDVILEWIFLPRKPNKKLKTYIEKISDLIHKERGRPPKKPDMTYQLVDIFNSKLKQYSNVTSKKERTKEQKKRRKEEERGRKERKKEKENGEYPRENHTTLRVVGKSPMTLHTRPDTREKWQRQT